jgi:hypothetical protein
MKVKKKEYLVLLLIIIGLSFYLLQRTGDRTLYELPDIPAVSPSEISRIQIDREGESVELVEENDRWWIEPEHYPADGKQVRDMLDIIGDLTLTALVAQSPDDVRYELGPEKKIAVKAWQKDRLVRDFEIGKTAPSFRHTFVKLAGDKRVFHARDNFRNRFEKNIEQLRDKQVLSFRIEDIREIRIVDGRSTLQLIPRENAPAPESGEVDASSAPAGRTWQTAEGEPAEDETVNQLLRRLSTLQCQSFIDPKNKSDFSEPIRSIHLAGLEEQTLSIYAKLSEADEQYPAVSSGSADPFLLSASQAEPLLKDLQNYFVAATGEKSEAAGKKSAED